MRTIYLGDTHLRNPDKQRTSRIHHKTIEMERTPRGRDMAVFDRRATGGREDFVRDWQDEDETILVRRGSGKWGRT